MFFLSKNVIKNVSLCFRTNNHHNSPATNNTPETVPIEQKNKTRL